jgi:glycosyltransferase involved in cell wall biosynthesis
MTSVDVVLLHLGRPGSLGGRRRIESLRSVFEAAGGSVAEIRLVAEHRLGWSDIGHTGVRSVVTGKSVPESMAWSTRGVLEHLEQLRPSVVVCCTARSYAPELTDGPWQVVLDFVDRLSVSYRDRATILGGGARRHLLRGLAITADRFERSEPPAGVDLIAAGWTDAVSLYATWVPNTIDPSLEGPTTRAPSVDVLFLGKLSYEPNAEAIVCLGRVWPEVTERRPGTTCTLAGADPTPAVTELADRYGWEVHADFDDLGEELARARIAVVPMLHASGIQSKILEAAAGGLPQVLTPAAAAGLRPGFPAVVSDVHGFPRAVADLLDDEVACDELGRAARAHVVEHYSIERWVPWAEQILDGDRG